MEEENGKSCCERKTMRDEVAAKKLEQRLNRIEGQVRGLKRMVETDGYCTDILIQVSAATEALHSFSKEILSEHIRTCVVRDVKEGKEETVEDLISTVRRLMK